jgi:drug/metabolite transporter (DMT)-like permease
VTELLALGSALVFGLGDFFGGLASRRATPVQITAVSQAASVVALVPLLLLVPATEVAMSDVAWGAAGGLFGMLGLLGLYTGLAQGPMGIVAPTTALLSALVPVAYGLATGERPGAVAVGGIVVGLAAIVAVSRSQGPTGRLSPRILAIAAGAGLGFGLFFIALAQTDVASGMWPLAGARAVSVPIAVVLAVRLHGPRLPGPVARMAVAAGVLDMVANALFLGAAQRGLIAIAAVLASLYPAVTALFARLVLHERMSRAQVAGVTLALVAIVLIGLP